MIAQSPIPMQPHENRPRLSLTEADIRDVIKHWLPRPAIQSAIASMRAMDEKMERRVVSVSPAAVLSVYRHLLGYTRGPKQNWQPFNDAIIEHKCWPSQKTIAENTYLSVRVIHRATCLLEYMGVMRIHVSRKRDGERCNSYFIFVPLEILRRNRAKTSALIDPMKIPQSESARKAIAHTIGQLKWAEVSQSRKPERREIHYAMEKIGKKYRNTGAGHHAFRDAVSIGIDEGCARNYSDCAAPELIELCKHARAVIHKQSSRVGYVINQCNRALMGWPYGKAHNPVGKLLDEKRRIKALAKASAS